MHCLIVLFHIFEKKVSHLFWAKTWEICLVNSAGGRFCWNYATVTFNGNCAGDNACCIYAWSEVVLSVTGILVDLSVAIMQVHFVAIMQLEVSAKHMHVAVSAANMLTFFCNYADGSLCWIVQVGFSTVHYAHECFYCNYAGDSFFYRYVDDSCK